MSHGDGDMDGYAYNEGSLGRYLSRYQVNQQRVLVARGEV